MGAWHDYTGVIHIHSEHSFDGRAPLEDILRAARRNGIDFLMLTDHACLTARENGMEGWRDDVLLIVGQEITPRFNHYLAFGIHTPITVDDGEEIPPQVYIDEVNRQGGIGFIAHPDHEGTELFHVKHFPWTEWDVSDYAGIGIWDFMSDWQSSLNNYPLSVMSYLCPVYFLRGPKRVTLERWDRLTGGHKIVGIGELDNHDTHWKIGPFTVSVFTFSRAFRFVRTHVLSDEPLRRDGNRDISVVLNALSRGRVYIAMEYFHNAKGFEFVISDGCNAVTMGDTFILKNQAELSIRVPVSAKIRIIRDGVLWWEGRETHKNASITDKGVYRVEVYSKSWGTFRPWIFSNPIYVR
jgi:hypothetical protein